MKVFKKILVLTVVTICSLKSYGCDCVEKIAENYLNNCEIIFVAVLSESRLLTKEPFRPIEKGKFSQITHVIKGKPEKEYSIINIRSGTSCDSPLTVGGEYVVCTEPGKILQIQPCGYTHYLHVSGEDFLNSFPGK